MTLLDILFEAQQYLFVRPLYLHLAASKHDLQGEVVEVAILETDGSPLLEDLVRPQGTIRPDMSAVHGITNELVRAAPPWAEVYPRVRLALEERRVVVYDVATCLGLMHRSTDLAHLRWEIDEENFIDVQSLFARFHGQRAAGSTRFQTYPMLEAANMLGLNTETIGHRRALEDAALLRAMLMALAQW
ncbi:MAG TPA: 3'-5' exonuclease [Anaerolineales bacterium]|nr:3'-5' exonuclease [Anaerolineales bacterium]